MIKSKHMAQIQALARVLDTEAGAYGGIQIAQANDGVIGVSRMNGSGKMENHTYIMQDGSTKEVDGIAEKE